MRLYSLYLAGPSGDAESAWLAETAGKFGGFSESDLKGGWINASGKLEEEPAIRVDVATNMPMVEVEKWAKSARLRFGQEAVLLSETGEAEMIQAKVA